MKSVLDIEGPGLSGGTADSTIGFRVADESFLNRIEGYLAIQFPGKLGGKARDVGSAYDVLITDGQGSGLHTIDEIPAMTGRTGSGFLESALLRLRQILGKYDFPIVAGFDPAFIPDETNRARPRGSSILWRPIAKRIGQEITDQLDAIGITTHDATFVRFVFDGHRVIGLVGPLA